MPQTKTIHVDQVIRPIRLAFLISPSDSKNLLKVFQYNSTLWGGCYNGIIPLFKRIPEWWDESKTYSATEIIKGYIEAFEPDYLVVVKEQDAEKLEFDAKRVLTLDQIISNEKEAPGLSIRVILEELYNKKYQFNLRHRPKFINPISTLPSEKLFSASVFGVFPSKDYGTFARDYNDVFSPEDVEIQAENYFQIFSEKVFTPFSVTDYKLDVRVRSPFGPTLFLLDVEQNSDLIDFWNLRALGVDIYPVVSKWVEKNQDSFANFIKKRNVPIKNNPYGTKRYTRILKSRKTADSDLLTFLQGLEDCPKDSYSIQKWHPRIWNSWARERDHVERCEVIHIQDRNSFVEDELGIELKFSKPTFYPEGKFEHKPTWAAIVNLQGTSSGSDQALIFPPNFPNLRKVLRHSFGIDVTSTSEGLVSICSSSHLTGYWKISTGQKVFKEWFTSKGFEVETSVAGKLTYQVIKALNGIYYARLIGDRRIIQLLDKMSHGLVESPLHESYKLKPRARSRTASWSQWWGLLKEIGGNDTYARNVLNALVDKGVLRLGISLKCTVCDQKNWFPLNSLSDSVMCESCLSSFQFPVTKPPRDAWEFRTRGPFSIENYSHGSYTVALALRFLTEKMDAESTWAAGLKIKNKQVDLEADFAIWRKSERFKKGVIHQIFGECKTFGEFANSDIVKMKKLAELFPGSILVFCTLREKLSQKEIKMISSLAKWGRKRIGDDVWMAPVLILTGFEMFGEERVPTCWKNAGGKLSEFGNNWGYSQNILEVCEATQILHLGMPSDIEVLSEKRQKKQRRIMKQS